jgi:hypothetical protein
VKRPYVHACLILLFAAAVRFRLLGTPSLPFDDAWVAVIYRADGLLQALRLSATAPGFGLIVHLWLSITGFSNVAAEMPAFVIGVLLPPAAYLVSLRLGFARAPAAIVALALAGSPALVEFSARVKQYTLDAAASFLILAVAWRLLSDLRAPSRWWALLGASVVAMALSTPAVVVAMAAFVAAVLAAWRRRESLRPALAPLGVVAIGAVVVWIVIVERFVTPGITRVWEPYLIQVNSGVWGLAESVLRPAARVATAGLPYGVVSIPVIAIAFLIVLRHDRDRFWLLALPIAGAFAAAALRIAPIGMKRTDCYMFPALALAVGLAAHYLGRWRTIALVATIAGAVVAPALRAHRPAYEHIAPLVTRLESSLAPDETVIIPFSTSLPFGVYTSWPVRLEPVARPVHPGLIVRVQRPEVVTMEGWYREPASFWPSIEPAVERSRTVWVMTSGSDMYWLPIIDALIDSLGYTRTETYDEVGARLARWTRTAEIGDGAERISAAPGTTADIPAVDAILDREADGTPAFVAPMGLGHGAGDTVLVADEAQGRVTSYDVTTTSLTVMPRGGWLERTPALWAAAGDGANVYVADGARNRIEVRRPDGTLARTFGASLLWFGLSGPRAVVLAGNGDAYVADFNNSRVRVFDRDGQRRDDITGRGTAGALQGPTKLALSPQGELFVTDARRDLIVVFDAAGAFERTIGAPGNGPGQLRTPHGVAIGPDGLLYVADYTNDRVQVFTTDGRFVRAIGRSGSKPGELRTPTDLLFLRDGRLVIADRGNHRLQLWRIR